MTKMKCSGWQRQEKKSYNRRRGAKKKENLTAEEQKQNRLKVAKGDRKSWTEL